MHIRTLYNSFDKDITNIKKFNVINDINDIFPIIKQYLPYNYYRYFNDYVDKLLYLFNESEMDARLNETIGYIKNMSNKTIKCLYDKLNRDKH